MPEHCRVSLKLGMYLKHPFYYKEQYYLFWKLVYVIEKPRLKPRTLFKSCQIKNLSTLLNLTQKTWWILILLLNTCSLIQRGFCSKRCYSFVWYHCNMPDLDFILKPSKAKLSESLGISVICSEVNEIIKTITKNKRS